MLGISTVPRLGPIISDPYGLAARAHVGPAAAQPEQQRPDTFKAAADIGATEGASSEAGEDAQQRDDARQDTLRQNGGNYERGPDGILRINNGEPTSTFDVLAA